MFKYLAVIETKPGAPALPAAAAVARSRADATITTLATADFPSIRMFLMGLSLFRHHDAHPGNTCFPLIFSKSKKTIFKVTLTSDEDRLLPFIYIR